MPTVPGGFLLGWECPWDLGLPMGSKGCCRVRGLYGAWGHQRGLLLPAGSMCAHGDGHLEVTVHHKAAVHVLQAQDDLGCVEPHLRLREDTVLREVIMQVPPCGKGDQLSLQHCPLLPQGRPNRRLQGRGSRENPALGTGSSHGPLTVHEVKDEAELVRRVEGVRHTHDERAVLARETGSGSAGGAQEHPTRGQRASQLPRPSALTPVLTRDNMMRSLRARVSPCFILMRFLSKHFMAYLGDKGSLQGPLLLLVAPRPQRRVPVPPAPAATSPHPAPAHGPRDVPVSPGEPQPW